MHSRSESKRDSPSIHVISGYGGSIQGIHRFAGADRIRLGSAPGLERCELQQRWCLRRHGAEAEHRPTASAMLVRTVLVGVTCCGRSPIMRVDSRLGIGMTVLMPSMPSTVMLMVVAMLMALCMLMSLVGVVTALNCRFGEVGRKWDG